MTKVCICDDDEAFAIELKKNLLSYSTKKKKEMQVDLCFSGENMIESLNKNRYNIVFLDIELGNIRGFEIGCKIRGELSDEKTQIVYISAKTNYAMELFETRPLNFLLKPLREKDVFEVLDTYYRLFGRENEYLHYKWLKKDYVISQNNIVYIQSRARKLIVKTFDDNIEFYAKIADILPQLNLDKFCQIHKSFVVNGNYISRYTSDSVTMCDGTNIVISRSMKKDVRDWLLKYMSY